MKGWPSEVASRVAVEARAAQFVLSSLLVACSLQARGSEGSRDQTTMSLAPLDALFTRAAKAVREEMGSALARLRPMLPALYGLFEREAESA